MPPAGIDSRAGLDPLSDLGVLNERGQQFEQFDRDDRRVGPVVRPEIDNASVRMIPEVPSDRRELAADLGHTEHFSWQRKPCRHEQRDTTTKPMLYNMLRHLARASIDSRHPDLDPNGRPAFSVADRCRGPVPDRFDQRFSDGQVRLSPTGDPGHGSKELGPGIQIGNALVVPTVQAMSPESAIYLVGRLGLEPRTSGLKVRCSTIELAAQRVPS